MTPRSLLADLDVGSGDGGPDARTFRVELSDAWSFVQPSGGVLMSIGLRAMAVVLADPGARPLSATATFATPIPAGPLEVSASIVRRGRAASQLRAAIQPGGRISPHDGLTIEAPSQRTGRFEKDPAVDGMRAASGGAGLEMLATFGADRDGYPDVVEAVMPDVEGPDALPPIGGSHELRMPFFENFEQRLAFGHFAWESEPWEPGPARYARWIRYRIPPLDGGAISELAFPPILDLMPPSLVHKVGREKARFMAPSLDLTVHFFERTEREWFLVSGLCRRASGGTASAQVELFDDRGTLVAYATQVMILKGWG